MKIHSLQFKFLMTVITAMLAITVFIGGLSIYEVDEFIQRQTEDLINVTCEKEISQIDDNFGDMEKAVHIMESYVYGMVNDKSDFKNPQRKAQILQACDNMFMDVAKHTEESVAYYLRIAPEISDAKCGFFYSRVKGAGDFVRFETTDLSFYEKNDTERVGWYWQPYEAQKPIWMMPYFNKNNRTLMISYVVPMYYNSEFIGVVGMDFDYAVLTQRVHNIKIYENGFAHLEFEGAATLNFDHSDEAKLRENPEQYLSVSDELKNGMKLVISASYNDIRKIRYRIGFKILFVVLFLATLFSLLAIIIVRRIVKPLKVLTEASVKLSNGDYNVEIIHSNTHEIKLLSSAFEKMTQNLKEHEEMQQYLAYRDSLTGLRNTHSYKAWWKDFEKEIKNKEKEINFGLLMLDINFLKETNDRYGHDAGNKLIFAAAQFVSGIFKRSPVFRIGGDEFLVVLKNRDLKDIDELLKKFDNECENVKITVGDKNIPLSIAKGFARYDAQNDLKFVDVFNRADDAMYENKRIIKESCQDKGV